LKDGNDEQRAVSEEEEEEEEGMTTMGDIYGSGSAYFLRERLMLTSQYTMWMSHSRRTAMPGDQVLEIADETGNQL
jgi:hypothetical protein